MVETPITVIPGSLLSSATAELSLRHDPQPGVQNQNRTSRPARLAPSSDSPPISVAVNANSWGMAGGSGSSPAAPVAVGAAVAEDPGTVVDDAGRAAGVADEQAVATSRARAIGSPMIHLTW